MQKTFSNIMTRLAEPFRLSGTAATKTAVYDYDDLYRLTDSSISNTIRGSDYTEAYSYDPLGNILNKSDQGDYSYSQPGKTNPHAVTKVDDGQGNVKTFTYDANGNLTQEIITTATGTTTKDLEWDHYNRMVQSTVTSEVGHVTTVEYTYDHSGRRLSKTVTNGVGS
ncbi:MAG: hypothetical protein U1C97_01595, partial [Candidatus Gracilibacteria bacterium]|nr:hypothetical protein [Candidatus Gracilibacteria bacterium]